MKVRLNLYSYTTLYFFVMLIIFHYKVKTYYYWNYIAYKIGSDFNLKWLGLFLALIIFYFNLKSLKKLPTDKISLGIIFIFYYLVTIPSLISYSSYGMYSFKLLLYHQLFFYSLIFFSKLKFNLNILPTIDKSQGLIFLTLLVCLGAIPFVIVLGPYINLNNLLLLDIYETRRIMDSHSNPFFAYLYSPFTKIIIPLIIVMSIQQKRWLFTIIGIILLLLFFLFGGHKTVYLGLGVLILFYKFSYRRIIIIVAKYSIILALFAMLLALFGYDKLWILIFRRVQFVPTLLDICYYDLFKDNYLYWSEGVFKRFIDSPFDTNHVRVIGENYFRNNKMAANNGLISDGFMNFGTIGVIIHILIISFYFSIINNLNIKPKYFGLYLLVILSFISSALTTVLLTHGGFVLIIISIFILNEKEN